MSNLLDLDMEGGRHLEGSRGQAFPFGATWRQRMTVRIEFENGKPFLSETIWDDP